MTSRARGPSTDDASMSTRESAPPAEETLLDVRDLVVCYDGVTAVDHFWLRLAAGSVWGLIGPNGAGKTTVLNAISRLVNPAGGSILFRGHDLLRIGPHVIPRLGIGRTFQNIELFRGQTVLDQVLIGGHCRLRTGILAEAVAWPTVRRRETAARTRALEILDFVGLVQDALRPVAILPPGRQKLVELARALALEPLLLLLDEPAAGLNTEETERLATVIERIRRDLQVTVLLVEHNTSLVMKVCDRITVMDAGRRIAEGSPAHIQEDPAVIRAYLGESRPC